MSKTATVMDMGEIIVRARRVRLVITDNDGVLTDGGVYYSERGEELKRYSLRDGSGVIRLRAAGIPTVILTGEAGGAVLGRAKKLEVTIYTGVADKAAEFPRILHEYSVDASGVAYIGDDYNDLGVMDIVNASGLTAAPADAMPLVLDRAHFHCEANGGHGAFREFAEFLLRHRDSQPA